MTDSSSDSADTVISVLVSRPSHSPSTASSLSAEDSTLNSDSTEPEQAETDDMGNRLGGERKKQKDEPPPERKPEDKPKKRGKKSKGKSKRNSKNVDEESTSVQGATASGSSKGKSKSKRPDVLADLGSQAQASPLGSPESTSGSQGPWETESDVSTLGYSTPLLSTPQVQRYVLPKQQQTSTERLEELGRSIEKTIMDKLSDQPAEEPAIAASVSAPTSCERKGRRNVRKKRALGQAVIDTDSFTLPVRDAKTEQNENKSPQTQRHLGTEKISLRASQETPVSPWLRDDDTLVDEEQMDEMFISCIDLSYNLADICSEKEFTEYGSLDSKKHPKSERARSKETSLSPRIARKPTVTDETPRSKALPTLKTVASRDTPPKSDSSTSTLAETGQDTVAEAAGLEADTQHNKHEATRLPMATPETTEVSLHTLEKKSKQKAKSKGKKKSSKETVKSAINDIPSDPKPELAEPLTLEVEGAAGTVKERTPVGVYDNLCENLTRDVNDSVFETSAHFKDSSLTNVDIIGANVSNKTNDDSKSVQTLEDKEKIHKYHNPNDEEITFTDHGEAELSPFLGFEESKLEDCTFLEPREKSTDSKDTAIEEIVQTTNVDTQSQGNVCAFREDLSSAISSLGDFEAAESTAVTEPGVSEKVASKGSSDAENNLVEKIRIGSDSLSPEGAASPKHVPPPSPSAMDALGEVDEEDEEALEALEANPQMNEVQMFGETVFKRLSSLVESQSQDEDIEDRFNDFNNSGDITPGETDSPPVNLGAMALVTDDTGDTRQIDVSVESQEKMIKETRELVEEELKTCSGLVVEKRSVPCVEIEDKQLSKEDVVDTVSKEGEVIDEVDDDTLKRKKKKKKKKDHEKQKRESIGSVVKKPEIPAELKHFENREQVSPSLRRKAEMKKSEEIVQDDSENEIRPPKRESQQIQEVIDAYGFDDNVDASVDRLPSEKPQQNNYVDIRPRFEDDDDEEEDDSDTSYYDDSKSSEVPSSSSFELSSRRIPEIEETFSELLSVKHILEDLEDRTPTEEGLPPFVASGELRSPPELLNGRRSRMSPAITDRTESDLDISEQRDDISTDSMYADDEDDGASEVLFRRSYSEPDGTEAVVSCTFYNTQHAANNNNTCDSDDFWEDYSTADESFKQIEISADAASSTFQNARKQMHDIHQHLQDLRRQMECLQEEVESATLTPDYSMDSEEKRLITE